MWNGRDPKQEVTSAGAAFGGIQHWRDGITTRGVLLDVPKFRGEPSVTIERPVHGWELEAVAEAQGVALEPGDAIIVHSGREAWQRAHPEWSGYRPPSPGLHSSCLPFLRDHVPAGAPYGAHLPVRVIVNGSESAPAWVQVP
jgi:hypothetical protein